MYSTESHQHQFKSAKYLVVTYKYKDVHFFIEQSGITSPHHGETTRYPILSKYLMCDFKF